MLSYPRTLLFRPIKELGMLLIQHPYLIREESEAQTALLKH